MVINSEAYLTKQVVQPSLIKKIKKAQSDDFSLKKIMETLAKTLKENYGSLLLKNYEKLCVLDDEGIKQEILYKAHCTPYSLYPCTTKMY